VEVPTTAPDDLVLRVYMSALERALVEHGIVTEALVERAFTPTSAYYQLQVAPNELLALWLQLRAIVPTLDYWLLVILDESILDQPSSADRPILDAIQTDSEHQIIPWLIATNNRYARLLQTHTLQTYPSVEWVLTETLQAIEQQYDISGENFLAYRSLRTLTKTALTQSSHWSQQFLQTNSDPTGLSYYLDPTHRLSPSYTLVLLPATKPWHIPIVLNYDGGASSGPEICARLWHSWFTRYGAEPVVLGNTGYTLRALRPPTTPEAALLLAWEHSVYCFDSIDRVSLVKYAQQLFCGQAWSFWWD
jgi:hypothetical protein